MSHGLTAAGAGGALVTILRSAAYAPVAVNAAATNAVARTFFIASPFTFSCSSPDDPELPRENSDAARTQATLTCGFNPYPSTDSQVDSGSNCCILRHLRVFSRERIEALHFCHTRVGPPG